MEQFQIGDVTIQRVIKDDEENLSEGDEERGEEYQSDHGEADVEDAREHDNVEYGEQDYPPESGEEAPEGESGEYEDEHPVEDYGDEQPEQSDYEGIPTSDIPHTEQSPEEPEEEINPEEVQGNMEESNAMERGEPEDIAHLPSTSLMESQLMDQEHHLEEERLHLETDPEDQLPPELEDEQNQEGEPEDEVTPLSLMESEDLLRKVKEEPPSEDDELNEDIEEDMGEERQEQDVTETLLESLAQSGSDGTIIKAEPLDDEDAATPQVDDDVDDDDEEDEEEALSHKRKSSEDCDDHLNKKKKSDETDDNDKSAAERKVSNLRRNIREVMDETQLDEATLSAQRQEMERLRRVQEQQKYLKEVQKQITVSRVQAKTQNKVMSLLSGASSSSHKGQGSAPKPNTVLVKLSSNGGPPQVVNKKALEVLRGKSGDFKSSNVSRINAAKAGMVTPSVSIAPVKPSPSPKSKEDVVEISSSSDEDDCIVISEPSEESDQEEEDPTNSGMHTNDVYNIPDEQGRVLINVGKPETDPEVFLAPQIARIIKPHQIGGVRFMFDNVVESLERYKTSPGFGCILAHSMGLGKTLQVVSFCDVFLRDTDAKSVMCIMPINTLQNWLAEFNMWLPSDPSSSPLAQHGDVRSRNFSLFVLNDLHKTLTARAKVVQDWKREGGVLLIGYEMYRQLSMRKNAKPRKGKKKNIPDEEVEDDKNKPILDEVYESLVKPGPDLVICDEGHRIKNSHASISTALKQIRTKRRIVLTGYPLQNNLLEYWCMVDFVRPNYLGSKAEFSNMFERPIQNGQCIDSTPQDIRLMRYRAHVLHSLLEGFVQRRSHSVLRNSLPQKEEYVLLVRMTPFQRKLYDKFMNDVVRTKAVPNPLKAFAVCCKIWNHPDILYNFLKKREMDELQELQDLDLEEAAAALNDGQKPKEKKGKAKKGQNKDSNKNLTNVPLVEAIQQKPEETEPNPTHQQSQQPNQNFNNSQFPNYQQYGQQPNYQQNYGNQSQQCNPPVQNQGYYDQYGNNQGYFQEGWNQQQQFGGNYNNQFYGNYYNNQPIKTEGNWNQNYSFDGKNKDGQRNEFQNLPQQPPPPPPQPPQPPPKEEPAKKPKKPRKKETKKQLAAQAAAAAAAAAAEAAAAEVQKQTFSHSGFSGGQVVYNYSNPEQNVQDQNFGKYPYGNQYQQNYPNYFPNQPQQTPPNQDTKNRRKSSDKQESFQKQEAYQQKQEVYQKQEAYQQKQEGYQNQNPYQNQSFMNPGQDVKPQFDMKYQNVQESKVFQNEDKPQFSQFQDVKPQFPSNFNQNQQFDIKPNFNTFNQFDPVKSEKDKKFDGQYLDSKSQFNQMNFNQSTSSNQNYQQFDANKSNYQYSVNDQFNKNQYGSENFSNQNFDVKFQGNQTQTDQFARKESQQQEQICQFNELATDRSNNRFPSMDLDTNQQNFFDKGMNQRQPTDNSKSNFMNQFNSQSQTDRGQQTNENKNANVQMNTQGQNVDAMCQNITGDLNAQNRQFQYDQFNQNQAMNQSQQPIQSNQNQSTSNPNNQLMNTNQNQTLMSGNYSINQQMMGSGQGQQLTQSQSQYMQQQQMMMSGQSQQVQGPGQNQQMMASNNPNTHSNQNQSQLLSSSSQNQMYLGANYLSSSNQNQQAMGSSNQNQQLMSSANQSQQLMSTANQNQQQLMSSSNQNQQLMGSSNQNQQLMSTANQSQQQLMSSSNQNQQSMSSANPNQQMLGTQGQQLLGSANQNQHLMGSANQNQQLMSSTNQSQQSMISLNQNQHLMNPSNQSQQLMGLANPNQQLMGSSHQNQQLLANQSQQLINSSNQNQQLMGSANQIQQFMGSANQNQLMSSSNQMGSANQTQQLMGSSNQSQQLMSQNQHLMGSTNQNQLLAGSSNQSQDLMSSLHNQQTSTTSSLQHMGLGQNQSLQGSSRNQNQQTVGSNQDLLSGNHNQLIGSHSNQPLMSQNQPFMSQQMGNVGQIGGNRDQGQNQLLTNQNLMGNTQFQSQSLQSTNQQMQSGQNQNRNQPMGSGHNQSQLGNQTPHQQIEQSNQSGQEAQPPSNFGSDFNQFKNPKGNQFSNQQLEQKQNQYYDAKGYVNPSRVDYNQKTTEQVESRNMLGQKNEFNQEQYDSNQKNQGVQSNQQYNYNQYNYPSSSDQRQQQYTQSNPSSSSSVDQTYYQPSQDYNQYKDNQFVNTQSQQSSNYSNQQFKSNQYSNQSQFGNISFDDMFPKNPQPQTPVKETPTKKTKEKKSSANQNQQTFGNYPQSGKDKNQPSFSSDPKFHGQYGNQYEFQQSSQFGQSQFQSGDNQDFSKFPADPFKSPPPPGSGYGRKEISPSSNQQGTMTSSNQNNQLMQQMSPGAHQVMSPVMSPSHQQQSPMQQVMSPMQQPVASPHHMQPSPGGHQINSMQQNASPMQQSVPSPGHHMQPSPGGHNMQQQPSPISMQPSPGPHHQHSMNSPMQQSNQQSGGSTHQNPQASPNPQHYPQDQFQNYGKNSNTKQNFNYPHQSKIPDQRQSFATSTTTQQNKNNFNQSTQQNQEYPNYMDTTQFERNQNYDVNYGNNQYQNQFSQNQTSQNQQGQIQNQALTSNQLNQTSQHQQSQIQNQSLTSSQLNQTSHQQSQNQAQAINQQNQSQDQMMPQQNQYNMNHFNQNQSMFNETPQNQNPNQPPNFQNYPSQNTQEYQNSSQFAPRNPQNPPSSLGIGSFNANPPQISNQNLMDNPSNKDHTGDISCQTEPILRASGENDNMTTSSQEKTTEDETNKTKEVEDGKEEEKGEKKDDKKEGKSGKEEPGIPYDWAVELMKGYLPGRIEESAKMMVFFCILEESIALGDRILVFSQSLFTLNLMEELLQQQLVPGRNEHWMKNVNYYRLDGSTSASEREKLINEFNSNPNFQMFLVSTRAGSLGINLVGANRVIVFDASWNPCHDTQAVCRVYRYGQKKPCFVYRLVTDNCLEKKIYDRQINKQGMADRVVDECNPEAHLSIKEVTSLCWDDKEDSSEPINVDTVKDRYIDVVIQKVLEKHVSVLTKEPFHHESLLVERKDKKLSQAEKRLAKRSYELEKQANCNNRPVYSAQATVQTRGGVKPMASVRPMQQSSDASKDKPQGRGWIPAAVWQRQGMSAQEMTLPLDVVIPTNAPDKASIVLKAGQRVMVLKSPKGIYMQLESGKIIAIRTAIKMGVNSTKKNSDLKNDPKKDLMGRPRGTVLPTLRNNSSVSIVPRSSGTGRGAVRPVRVLNKQGVQGKTVATARPYMREPEITMTPVRKKINLPGCSTSNSVQISKISPSGAVKPTAPAAAQVKPDVALSKIKDTVEIKTADKIRMEPQKPVEALKPMIDQQKERLEESVSEPERMEEDVQDDNNSVPYYTENPKHSGVFDPSAIPHSSMGGNRFDEVQRPECDDRPIPNEERSEPMRPLEISRPFAEVSRNQHQSVEPRPFAELSRSVEISRVDRSRQFDINQRSVEGRSYGETSKTPENSRSYSESRPFAEISRSVETTPSRPFEQQRPLLDPTRPFAEISSARHNVEARSFSESRVNIPETSRTVEPEVPRYEPQLRFDHSRPLEPARSFEQPRTYQEPQTSRSEPQRSYVEHRPVEPSRPIFDHSHPLMEPSRPIIDPPRNILEPMKPVEHPRSDPLRSIIDQSRSVSEMSRPIVSEPSRPIPDISRNISQIPDISRQIEHSRPIPELSVPLSIPESSRSMVRSPRQDLNRPLSSEIPRSLPDLSRPLPPLADLSRPSPDLSRTLDPSRPLMPDPTRTLPDFSRPMLDHSILERGDISRTERVDHRSEPRSSNRPEPREIQRPIEASTSRSSEPRAPVEPSRSLLDPSSSLTSLPLLDAMRSSLDRPVARPEPIRHLDDRSKPEISFAPYHTKDESNTYKPPPGYPPVGYPSTYPAYPAYPPVYPSAFHRPEPTPFAPYPPPYTPFPFPPPHFQPPPQ